MGIGAWHSMDHDRKYDTKPPAFKEQQRVDPQ
jgi:hypothetical protein